MHYREGCYSIAAFVDGIVAGYISAYPSQLPKPLDGYCDAYIDILAVDEKYRRKGIAASLLAKTEAWASSYGYRQIRAWSSDDKLEAIAMWYALGYGVCPAVMRGESMAEGFDGKRIHGVYAVKALSEIINK